MRRALFNLSIIRSIRNKLLWALRYANVHSGVDVFVISWYQNDNCRRSIVPVNVSRSRIAERAIVLRAFDVMILYLSQDDKVSSCGI